MDSFPVAERLVVCYFLAPASGMFVFVNNFCYCLQICFANNVRLTFGISEVTPIRLAAGGKESPFLVFNLLLARK